LVFPTDVETQELAEGLGLATYYDEKVGCSRDFAMQPIDMNLFSYLMSAHHELYIFT